jgi:hypothetical protein
MENYERDTAFEVDRVIEQPQPGPVTPYQGMGMLTPEMIARAEACVDGIKQVKQLSLRATNFTDWIKIGDKGYLAESGCEKVSRLFGIDWGKPTIRVETETIDGREVKTYICDIVAVFEGKRYPQQGVVSSEGAFYSEKSEWSDGPDGKRIRNKIEIPYGERDFVKMRKHALTNAMGRGLRGILGLNGIPWADVETILGREHAGKSANVGFDKGGTAPKPAQTVDSAEAVDYRKKLWSMCLDLGDHDDALAGNVLEKATSFTKDGKEVKGFRDPFNARISDKWIQAAYGKIKKDWEPTFGGPPEGA